jgi:8-oxo-dGTP pyrophosphatase MutT (NUDIX family)
MTTPRRINVRGIIFKDGKMLCQQLKANANNLALDWWCTPGGGLETGESLYEGLRREMIEETNIAPNIGKLLFIQQFHDGTKEQLEFFFHIENVDDYATIDLATASHGELEIERVEFVALNDKNILPAFLQKIDIQKYIESEMPVFISNSLPESH